MKFLLKNKKIFAGLFVILLLIIGSISLAHAADTENNRGITPNTSEAQAKDTASGATLLSYVSSRILGLAFLILHYSSELSNGILDLAAVQFGWSIVLSFANLGFVLAIIIIAFATILRIESYSIKSILWKLIVAAILVNFSLVIAGGVLSVADALTDLFAKALQQDNLANALANALNPQQVGAVKSQTDMLTSTVNSLKSLSEVLSDPIGTFYKMVASLLFSIVFTFLMILSILAVAIMFLVRTLHLVMLIIVSPIIWLFWIFPYAQNHWKNWWISFLRWTFFAPLMMFFIYLTIATAGCINTNQECVMTGQKGSTLEAVSNIKKSNTVGEAVSEDLFQKKDYVEYAANLILLLGILVGGLFVSNEMGAAGAGWAYGIAQNVGKGTSSWAKKIPLRAGSAAMRPGKWGEKTGGKIRDTGENLSRKKGWYHMPTRWLGKKMTGVGGAVERAPGYKAPSLYQSIRKEIYGAAKKEVPDRRKQLRKDVDAVNKEIENWKKFKTRMVGQITLENEKRINEDIDILREQAKKLLTKI